MTLLSEKSGMRLVCKITSLSKGRTSFACLNMTLLMGNGIWSLEDRHA